MRCDNRRDEVLPSIRPVHDFVDGECWKGLHSAEEKPDSLPEIEALSVFRVSAGMP
jgi:hypothetical protein